MKISIDTVKVKIREIFKNKGFSDNDTNSLVEYLMWAEMSGKKTQGLLKMMGTEPIQDIKAKSDICIEKETQISQRINAGANPSIIASQQATETVIEKAKSVGMGIVGVNNIFSSNGCQAFYAEKIAEAGLIGIVASRSPGAIAAFNSIDPLFGTNPMGFSFPTLDKPFVFDMATSAITFYGLVLADMKGEDIEEGVAIDGDGELTINPGEAMKGGILPFDKGYKGSCLAMMVELLAGPMSGSSYCDFKTFEEDWGATFIAIDPNILVDIDDFRKQSSDMLSVIRRSRTKNGEPVRLPGDESRKLYDTSKESGFVDIDEEVLRELAII